MFKKLLVAYDGSASSEAAFSASLRLASLCNATVAVLSIATAPQPPNEVETEATVEASHEYFERQFAGLKERASRAGIAARFETRVGHPSRHIIDYAEQAGSDIIVVGHRGRGLVGRLVLGSVAKHVIDLAHCPVLVVR